MFKSHIFVCFRNLWSNKLLALFNIIGLSIGISASLLVYNYLGFHLNFDRMFRQSENIYRIITEVYVDEKHAGSYGVTMQFLGPELKQFSEVEDAVRMVSFETMLAYKGEEKFHDVAIWGVDSSFLDFFGLKLLAGGNSRPLNQPNTAVLSKSMALKMFGTLDVVGKDIQFGYGFHDPFLFKITGVVEDAPINSHISYDILISAVDPDSIVGKTSIFNGGDPSYYYPYFNTYVRLNSKASPQEVSKKLDSFLQSRIRTQMNKYGERKLFLQPLNEIHLGNKYQWGADVMSGQRKDESSTFAIRWILVFALILLAFSIFNFINLSLVNYSRRWKELEMKRILGAQTKNFLQQFFIEATIITGIAVIMSVILLMSLKKTYYEYLSLPEQFSSFDNLETFVYLGVIFTGILTLKAIILFICLVLIRIFSGRKSEISFGRYLVILQFIVTFIMLNITIYLKQQIDFILNKDLGYTKDHILFIRRYEMGSGINSLSISHLHAFENELTRNKDIVGACLSSITPGSYHHSNQNTWVDVDRKINSNTIFIDRNYLSVYGLKLLAGSNLTENDKDKVLINKALMKLLGFTDANIAVGQSIYIDDAMAHHVNPGAKIIAGVLDDYFQEPLNKTIAPTKYHYADINKGKYSVKFRGENYSEIVAYVENVFKKFYPGDTFNYTFLDGFLLSQYQADIQFKELLTLTSFLSLIIASLGILGLIIYSIEVNKKSTAIRRVLGSSNLEILGIFLKGYIVNFGVALVLAFPLTYFLVKEMLADYAYRVEINGLYAMVPAALILVLIFIIIGIQVFKAYESPVRTLRQQ